MSSDVQKPVPKKAATPRRTAARVHSIPAWIKGRQFTGEFQIGASKYNLVFAPSRGEITGKKMQLVGLLTISGPGKTAHQRQDFRMTLLANQGGIGRAPSRHHHHDLHGVAGVPQDASHNQTPDHGQTAGLPTTDSTGSRSFCGVMYFRMEPVNGRAMGVAADMSRVQLNLRLYPITDQERDFQDIYSELVAAVCGKEFDGEAARAVLEDLNKALA